MFTVSYQTVFNGQYIFASNVNLKDALMMVEHLIKNGSSEHDFEEMTDIIVTKE